jgi:hypothetical protein
MDANTLALLGVCIRLQAAITQSKIMAVVLGQPDAYEKWTYLDRRLARILTDDLPLDSIAASSLAIKELTADVVEFSRSEAP